MIESYVLSYGFEVEEAIQPIYRGASPSREQQRNSCHSEIPIRPHCFFIKYSCMAFAAFFPAPMADITVAWPVTMSPPA